MRFAVSLMWAASTTLAVAHPQEPVQPVIRFYVPGVDGLSRSIALYHDTVLLGSIDPEVYVFQRDGGAWWMDRLIIPDGNGWFMEVALHQNVALIGVQPRAYVFRFDGVQWVHEKTLVDELGDPEFGYTVAIEGDLAIVGTRSVDAQVFRNLAQDWVLEARLAPPPRADGKYPYGFADDVEVDDERVLVSKSQTIGDNFEGVYSFRYDAGKGWYHEDTFTLTEVEGDTVFHGDIALDGDVALIAADYDDVVHVFGFDGASWRRQAIIAPPEISSRKCSCLPIPTGDPERCDGDSTPNFGVSVALDGDRALVGANLDDVNGTDAGAAYLYRFDGAAWIYQLMLQGEPGPFCGADFGRLVALHDGRALVRQGQASYFFEIPSEDSPGTVSSAAGRSYRIAR
jgi:hypothetical protein